MRDTCKQLHGVSSRPLTIMVLVQKEIALIPYFL
jgi:hypothetical protein